MNLAEKIIDRYKRADGGNVPVDYDLPEDSFDAVRAKDIAVYDKTDEAYAKFKKKYVAPYLASETVSPEDRKVVQDYFYRGQGNEIDVMHVLGFGVRKDGLDCQSSGLDLALDYYADMIKDGRTLATRKKDKEPDEARRTLQRNLEHLKGKCVALQKFDGYDIGNTGKKTLLALQESPKSGAWVSAVGDAISALEGGIDHLFYIMDFAQAMDIHKAAIVSYKAAFKKAAPIYEAAWKDVCGSNRLAYEMWDAYGAYIRVARKANENFFKNSAVMQAGVKLWESLKRMQEDHDEAKPMGWTEDFKEWADKAVELKKLEMEARDFSSDTYDNPLAKAVRNWSFLPFDSPKGAISMAAGALRDLTQRVSAYRPFA